MIMKNIKVLQSLFLLSFFLLFVSSNSHKDASPYPMNKRLKNAYIALQAWKKSMSDDPNNVTSNWHGYDVCSYNGVFCAPALDSCHEQTVAGIDLNHANISGTLPRKLGLLTDLSLFHLNTNRFCGTIPDTIKNWYLLHELDVSNNNLYGGFPKVILLLPKLKFIDLRYNHFEGPVPSELFDLDLDAIFINNNKFTCSIPENIGNSPVSAAVLAHNNFQGCIPSSISKMSKTLNELVLENTGVKGCLPHDIGKLTQLNVLDISHNKLSGSLPTSMEKMKNLEQLDVAFNEFYGVIPEGICSLPKLKNFTYSFNFFDDVPQECLKLKTTDNRFNCITNTPAQRSSSVCSYFNAYHSKSCGRAY